MVRQQFIYQLHTRWGYPLEQMTEEVPMLPWGRGSTRADILVAASPEARSRNRDWRIVVEVKAENVPIDPRDYGQGESYARSSGAEFLVLHNSRTTSFCRVAPGAPGELVEITGIPTADELNNDKRLEEIRNSTKAFTRDEFQRMMHDCHSILRDSHKMEPGTAFDEISKILFIKMAMERTQGAPLFTTETFQKLVDDVWETQDAEEKGRRAIRQLFDKVKEIYRADNLFRVNEEIAVSPATFRAIVKKLERFSLSDTGDDVKGIAFERFLGQTFRGELGQFFTPRPIVNFMVEMLNPREGQRICDPASGTGGFLIKAFEYIRANIEKDVTEEQHALSAAAEAKAAAEGWPEERLVRELQQIQQKSARQLDVTNKDSRIFKVAHECISGVDAEPRAARTSKMNMIMHGDGHGGIHYHDGLLDVAGVFKGRFNVIITNPPFGATVGRDQLVGATEQTQVERDPAIISHYRKVYGAPWVDSHNEMKAAAEAHLPILSLFDIGRLPIGAPLPGSKVRPSRETETLFIERSLDLLQPGGRLGIVLPDGLLNNPSKSWLREYVEGRAKIQAIVSIPQEVFASSNATVKTSLVFLQKFTSADEEEWINAREQGRREAELNFADELHELEELAARIRWYGREALRPLVEKIESLQDGGQDKESKKRLQELRSDLRAAVTPADKENAKQLRKEHTARLAELNKKIDAFARQRAREIFSYPVFMAEAEAAGITATGETGARVPNDLPGILADYREFERDPDGFARTVAARLHAASTEDGE
ncbi:restriction endonuclease subunit M [Streptomyces leeuwenhoekii]|jgi:type I restriction enzyme M protein|uniref:restriction endonuclease subunit M n=1 Tax=Streptomyces leeuwenhoekii TaxID=1437453 RepID=UPI00131C60BE|nr:N-6 DNA methylase [Streptomyces leeuwenhoekii]